MALWALTHKLVYIASMHSYDWRAKHDILLFPVLFHRNILASFFSDASYDAIAAEPGGMYRPCDIMSSSHEHYVQRRTGSYDHCGVMGRAPFPKNTWKSVGTQWHNNC
jgi:hypothetical protein